MEPMMTPGAAFALVMFALVIDWMSFGPNSFRDRLAFLMALPALAIGWDGSSLDQWTVERVEAFLTTAKDMSEGAYMMRASAATMFTVLVGALAVYATGALMPDKWANKVGGFARISFARGGGGGTVIATGKSQVRQRLNLKLWAICILLAMWADVPGGAIGDILRWFIQFDGEVMSGLPDFLIGVA